MKEIVIQLLMGTLGSLGFAMMFGLRRRYLFVASLGGLLTLSLYLALDAWTHQSFLSNLLATAFAVLYSELLAKCLRAPVTLFLTPSIVPLVPGGSLYYTMSYVVRGAAEEARIYGLATMKTALAIAAGISFVLACFELFPGRKKA